MGPADPFPGPLRANPLTVLASRVPAGSPPAGLDTRKLSKPSRLPNLEAAGVTCGRRFAPILGLSRGDRGGLVPSVTGPLGANPLMVRFASRRVSSRRARYQKALKTITTSQPGGGGGDLRSALRADPRSVAGRPWWVGPKRHRPARCKPAHGPLRVPAGSPPAASIEKAPPKRGGAYGGGGSRTRVREKILKSHYVRRSLSASHGRRSATDLLPR